jgi:amino acid transporter
MTEPTPLKRVLSLPLLVFYGLGTILGAGIYVLVGKVAGLAGMYAPVSFLLAALLTMLTGLTYTELCARFPHSAGSALYVQEGFGIRPLSVLVGWLIVLTGIVSSATLAIGFTGYLGVFVVLPDWLVIGALVLGFGLLAIWGIAESVVAAAVATVIEIAGLLLILVVAGGSLAEMPSRATELIPSFEGAVWQGIVLGAFLAFYAFIGFEDMVTVAEEVKDPQRNLPRAIVIAMVITTVLYLLVALAAVLSLPLGELVGSKAPLALVYERHTGMAPWLISFIGLFAVANGALIQIIMSSRMLYGMSRQGWQTELFGRVHPVRRTPVIATVLVTLLVLLLALTLPLVMLAQITSFIILVVFALINLALFRIKRRAPTPPGVRAIPAWVPVAGFVVTTGLILFQAADWLNIGR